MNQPPAGRLAMGSRSKVLVLSATAMAVLTLFLACQSPRLVQPAATSQATPHDPAQEVEERYGIRITLIGVTADGGLIDLRFRVIDPDKAQEMVQETENPLVLVAEHSGTKLAPVGRIAQNDSFVAGRIYFTLYPNAGGAIRPGDAVTVVIGDLRLEHLIAQ